MTVAIYGRCVNDAFFPLLKRIVEQLQEREVAVACEEQFARFLKEKFEYEGSFSALFDSDGLAALKADMLLSIGGDGTFLDTVLYVKDSCIPVLGINSGRLGFLANIAISEIDGAIDSICSGEYVTELREMLCLEVENGEYEGFRYALNEISVLKSENSSLLKIHAYIGNTYLTTYWSDGLIVATPTGSTAYSLSGGGPIVSPDCRNIILTPVCPHNLSMRPLVVPNEAVITLKVEGRSGDFVLNLDSRVQKMADTAILKISVGDYGINVVKLRSHNYYETLRNKLMWGEDVRNK